MKSLFLFVFVFVIASASAAFGQHSTTAEWEKFTPPAGHLSISFPGTVEPTEEKKSVPTSALGPYTTYLYTLTHDRAVYLVGWVDYTPSVRLNVQGELAMNRDNFVKGLKAKLTGSSQKNFLTSPGIEFTAETDAAVARSHVFVVGKRPYMLTVLYAKGRDNTANIERFFSSFQLNRK